MLTHVQVVEAISWVERDSLPEGRFGFGEISDRHVELCVQGTPVWRLSMLCRGGALVVRDEWLVPGYGDALLPAEA